MPYASYPFAWSNTTTAPPAAGEIRLNNNTQTAATLVWVSEQDSTGLLIPATLALLNVGDALRVIDQTDGASYQWYDMTGPVVDATGYFEMPVAWNSGGNTVKANRSVNVTFVAPSTYTGSAYATVDELAAALRLTVTSKNRDVLQSCLEAAAAEIDHALGRLPLDPLPDPTPALVNRVNVDRAVEWFKSSDAAFGGVGFADTGILRVPADGFSRHAAALMPLTQTFGIA